MEKTRAPLACRLWNGYLKSFAIATLIGILAGACFGSLAHAAPATQAKISAESTGIAGQIASSGRVRQQAQRIAKLYQQIGMGLDTERARRQVIQATRQLDTDISGLMRSAVTEKNRQLLERASTAWETMKRDCDSPFTMQNRQNIFIQADELAMLSGRLSTQFELGASAPTSRLLDLALRQGMLVQRLARLVCASTSSRHAANFPQPWTSSRRPRKTPRPTGARSIWRGRNGSSLSSRLPA
jgi:hypothetical protein